MKDCSMVCIYTFIGTLTLVSAVIPGMPLHDLLDDLETRQNIMLCGLACIPLYFAWDWFKYLTGRD